MFAESHPNTLATGIGDLEGVVDVMPFCRLSLGSSLDLALTRPQQSHEYHAG